MQGKQVRARKEDSLRTEAIWALHERSWPRPPFIRRPLTPSLVRKPALASFRLLAELLKAVRHGWKSVAGGEGEVLRAQVVFPWVQAG